MNSLLGSLNLKKGLLEMKSKTLTSLLFLFEANEEFYYSSLLI